MKGVDFMNIKAILVTLAGAVLSAAGAILTSAFSAEVIDKDKIFKK